MVTRFLLLIFMSLYIVQLQLELYLVLTTSYLVWSCPTGYITHLSCQSKHSSQTVSRVCIVC